MSSPGSKDIDFVDHNDKSGGNKHYLKTFRNWIGRELGAKHPPEKGRYHLFVNYACPWAHSTLIARKLKGLEDFITVSVVHCHLGESGRRFVSTGDDEPGENAIPDPTDGYEGFPRLREVYYETEKECQGRYTVPVLYDKIMKRIVNNESSEIIRMLGSEFDDFIDEKYRGVNLYPEELRSQIDDACTWQHEMINKGVYKCGVATTAEDYERHVHALFKALDRVEKHLMEQNCGPYYFGKMLTEVDIRLYVTIIRFDPVYVQHFRCNICDIRSGYPALHKWLRNLYWKHPAFHDTTQFEHIKWQYTRSRTQTDQLAITPVGPLPHILPLDREVSSAEIIIKGNNTFAAGVIVSYIILAVIVLR